MERKARYIKTGKLVKEARLRKGFTQEEFGKKLNLSHSFIAHIEQGVYFPFKHIEKLNSILDITLDYIYFKCNKCGEDYIPERENNLYCSIRCRNFYYNNVKNYKYITNQSELEGKKLKEARKNRSLSQEELAIGLGFFSKSIVTSWEDGRRNITPYNKNKINEFFGKDIFDD